MENVKRKVNQAETSYFMDSYEPEDSYYDEATDLAVYMGDRGDVDSIQDMLQCSGAYRDGKPKPDGKLRCRKPIRTDLQIKGPVWTDLSPDLKTAWARETGENKEKIIAQFKEPVTKNRQLTAYEANRNDGYDSDFTANTQNSEGTFAFHAYNAKIEFDTSASVNSDGELEGVPANEPTNLIVNAAGTTSILRNGKKQSKRALPKSSEMSSGAPAKLLANEQLTLVDKKGNTYGHMTFRSCTMAQLNYTRCDTLIPTLIEAPAIHYKVNLAQTIGGINLALCDGGANGCIKGNDMRVLYYNDDGRRVSIGIAGDHQLTGARLCTAASMVETNQGLLN